MQISIKTIKSHGGQIIYHFYSDEIRKEENFS